MITELQETIKKALDKNLDLTSLLVQIIEIKKDIKTIYEKIMELEMRLSAQHTAIGVTLDRVFKIFTTLGLSDTP